MKSVLISIRPKWCEKIANGEKTIEVRKTRPKLETPFKCYIYCTLSGSNEFFKETLNGDIAAWNRGKWTDKKGNVIGEFVCDKTIGIWPSPLEYPFDDMDEYCITDENLKQTCLKYSELDQYGAGSMLFGWNISDLKIYDQPKELSEFAAVCKYKNDDGTCPTKKVACSYQQIDCNQDGSINLVECGKKIERPPQSWCYVEEL